LWHCERKWHWKWMKSSFSHSQMTEHSSPKSNAVYHAIQNIYLCFIFCSRLILRVTLIWFCSFGFYLNRNRAKRLRRLHHFICTFSHFKRKCCPHYRPQVSRLDKFCNFCQNSRIGFCSTTHIRKPNSNMSIKSFRKWRIVFKEENIRSITCSDILSKHRMRSHCVMLL
jgi:hypothetical protein